MNIKYGSFQYFELLTLSDRLKLRCLDKLGLDNLDKLRNEVQMKIEQIDYSYKNSKNGK